MSILCHRVAHMLCCSNNTCWWMGQHDWQHKTDHIVWK